MTRPRARLRLGRTLLLLGLLTALGYGLLVAALGLYLPRADSLRVSAKDWIEAAVGYRAEAGQIALVGHGLGIRLVVDDLSLRDPTTGIIQLRAARLQLDLDGPASLLARAPRIDGGQVSGAQATVRREADGRLVIPGLDRLTIDDGKIQEYFLKHGDLRLLDAHFAWQDGPDATPRPLADLTLELKNHGRRHRLVLDVTPAAVSAEATSHIALQADLRGAAATPGEWTGRFAVDGSDLDLRRLTDSPFAAARIPAGLAQARGHLGLHAEGEWTTGAPTSIKTRFALRGLTLAGADTPIDRLSGVLRWHATATGWQARIPGITLAQGAQHWSGDGIDLHLADIKAGRALTADIAHLDLSLIDRFLPLAPLPDAGLLADLAGAQIGGHGQGLAFRMTLPDGGDAKPDWRLRGRLFDLHTSASGRIPGIAGLNAVIDGSPAGGRGTLAASRLVVDFPDLFRAPLPVGQLAGELRWERNPAGDTILEFPELLAENADITTLSQLRLRIPAADGAPEIALRTHFDDAEVAAVPRYLPVGIMRPQLVRWLDRALPRGRVPAGELLVLGPLDAFPFDHGEGRFEVLFDVEDLELSYDADWPSIVHANGRLRFLNRRLDIELSDARTLATDLGPVQAAIADLHHAERVMVHGEGRGPFADGLRLIEESPLVERLGPLSENFTADGPMHLDLDLVYPLRDKMPLALRGEVTWPTQTADIRLVDSDIALEGLAGTLVVTADGLTAEQLTGQLGDQPVELAIQPAGGDEATRVEIDGVTPIDELAERFPNGLWSLVAGRLPWHLGLTFQHRDLQADSPPLDWQLTSDLAGVRLDLPAPFGKPASTRRAARLAGNSVQTDEGLTIDVDLGTLTARLGLAQDSDGGLRLERGLVGLGAPAATLPREAGLVIEGTLEELDVPAWLAWAERHDLDVTEQNRSAAPLRRIDLRIAQLDLGAFTSDAVELQAERRSRSWQAWIDTAELAGTLTLPDAARETPLQIELSRLDLGEILDPAAGDEAKAKWREAGATLLSDPRNARPFTLDVERLLWHGASLGNAQIRSFTVPSGLVFDRLHIGGPPATIVGSGEWTLTDAGTPRTELTVEGSSADLGSLLQTIGYASVIDKTPVTAHLNLQWPGGPSDVSPATIAGGLSFEVGSGRLLAVEPGLGRVLGILNLGALQRRLALDFSDLYGKGFSFKKIDGALDIAGGLAQIDHFQITGPSGVIDIAGSTNFIAGQLNQIVTVTPEVSSSVALASAVAGGPLVGAAVYVADQVAGGVVDRLTRYQYRVTGPWADPTMTRSDRLGNLFSGMSGGDGASSPSDGREKEEGGEEAEPPNFFLDTP